MGGRSESSEGRQGCRRASQTCSLMQRILEDKDSLLPAALVQPHTGKLCWFLDEAAAGLLTVPFEKHSTL